MSILVFGDSIACGCWDEEGGWVDRLRRYLNRKFVNDLENAPFLYNLGVDCDTTEWLLQRFEREAKERIFSESMIIFAIGINDSEFVNKSRSFFTSPEKFRRNLGLLIKKAKKFASRVLFVGLTPVDDSKLDPIPWVPERSYKSKYVEKYNRIIKEVCLKNQVDFLEIYSDLKNLGSLDFLVDGIHPNSKGHQMIFQKVRDYFEKIF